MSDWSPYVCGVCGGGVAKGREEHLHLLINLTHTSWSIRRQAKRGSIKSGNKEVIFKINLSKECTVTEY